MKIINYLAFIAIVCIFASCKKESLTQQKSELSIENTKTLSVQHGMLVFDSKENLQNTLFKVQKMSQNEKRTWEEKLGFKSYDRVCQEIIDAEILHNEKYENLSQKEQENLRISNDYEEYSELAKKYIEKGIAKVVTDENGEKNLEFSYRIFSSIINEDGMIAIGNNIYQYTEKQFKYLKSLDFAKIDALKNTDIIINNEEIFVSNIISSKKSITVFNKQVISLTVDKKKVVLSELYNYYGPYSDGTTHALYGVSARAEKKNWLGSWVGDNTYVILYGSCNVYDGDTNPAFSFEQESYDGIVNLIPYDQWYPAGHIQPTIPISYSVAFRSGGSNGIGVAMENHDSSNPIYLP